MTYKFQTDKDLVDGWYLLSITSPRYVLRVTKKHCYFWRAEDAKKCSESNRSRATCEDRWPRPWTFTPITKNKARMIITVWKGQGQ